MNGMSSHTGSPQVRKASQSARIHAVQKPIIPIVGELTQAQPGTISLGQGVVAYPPPRQALEQIAHFTAQPQNHKYKLVQGIPELLSEIQQKLSTDNGIQVEALEQVVVTAGSNMGFNNAVLAIADPGDEIILPAPFYFNHEMAIRMANCVPKIVPTKENHQLDLNRLFAAIGPRTKAIVTISPNNPSGAIYPPDDLKAVNDRCRELGLYHISDEAYEYFTYDGAQHFSPGSLPDAKDHTISLYSLSKAYGFASWRIGYMVIPPHLLEAVKKIQDTILICPPVISQYAACGALQAGKGFWKPKVEHLASVREMVMDQLSELRNDASVAEAKGAFYFLIKLPHQDDPLDVIRHLISRHSVAAIPGTAFGLQDGCFIRLAYAALESDSLREGIGRFVSGIISYEKQRAR